MSVTNEGRGYYKTQIQTACNSILSPDGARVAIATANVVTAILVRDHNYLPDAFLNMIHAAIPKNDPGDPNAPSPYPFLALASGGVALSNSTRLLNSDMSNPMRWVNIFMHAYNCATDVLAWKYPRASTLSKNSNLCA